MSNRNPTPDYTLREAAFARHMRMVQLLGHGTDITVKVREDGEGMAAGDIFLFNHFTRFETLVLPGIIYRKTGKMVRSVAHSGLFRVNEIMARTMRQAGGLPHDMARLLPFLTEEILRGRKVIIFPEGGMVKDKHVLNPDGSYSVFSPTSNQTRKLHRGAAALALMTDLVKRRIRAQFAASDVAGIDSWCAQLGLDYAQLRTAVEKPTLIVPGNITFYPLRIGENILARGMERLVGQPGAQALDEVTIEGNMLLRPTDMDIRFGIPFPAVQPLRWDHAKVLDHTLGGTKTVDDVFALHEGTDGLMGTYVKRFLDAEIERIREDYAQRIYEETTINMNHLAASLIAMLVERGQMEMPVDDFHKVIYLALKDLQRDGGAHLHCSLTRPAQYAGLPEVAPDGLKGFMAACTRAKLLKKAGDFYRFSLRLRDAYEFHEVRLENPVQVHVNEAAPVPAVARAMKDALARVGRVSERQITELLFDDMVRAHAGQRYRFSKRAPGTLLRPRSADFGEPYLLLPQARNRRAAKVGVLLVHGFATSPAELREFGEMLHREGHAVLGVRLPGHGSSYLEMDEPSRADWLDAVRTGLRILHAHSENVVAVGFSTGAALSLKLAQEEGVKLAGVASVSAPVLVYDKNIHLLPLVMAARAVLRHIPGLRHALRFYGYGVNQPDQTYSRVPVHALNELRLLMKEMVAGLGKVKIPVLVVQGLSDHTVKAKSATVIFNRLGGAKDLKWIAGGPHGLIGQNFGATWEVLREFVAKAGGIRGVKGRK